jgi:hypothetical protein
MLVRMWELFYTISWNINYCNHYGNSMEGPQKARCRATIDTALPLLDI